MRNLFYLLDRFHLILLLFLLEGIAIASLGKHYEYQDARITNMSASIAGKVFEIRSGIADYFRMKGENRRLAEENAALLAKVEYLLQYPQDSLLPVESEIATFSYVPAKIVDNSITESINYLMLNKGLIDNVNKGQGVISSDGVVGIITHVSENYSLAMSVISTKSRISVRHKNLGAFGNLTWDGVDPFILSVDNVSKTNPVAVGDTFVTAGYSNFFPPDIPVGIVTDVQQDPATSFLYIDVKLSNRLDKVDYVYIVKSADKPEIDSLLLNKPQFK
jgi:rod shape-determining protein MreC